MSQKQDDWLHAMTEQQSGTSQSGKASLLVDRNGEKIAKLQGVCVDVGRRLGCR